MSNGISRRFDFVGWLIRQVEAVNIKAMPGYPSYHKVQYEVAPIKIPPSPTRLQNQKVSYKLVKGDVNLEAQNHSKGN